MASLALAVGSVASGILGANAASSAAKQQAQQEQNALNFQEQVYAQQQANQAPFLKAGTASLSQLMADLGNGTFGPNTVQAPAPFAAPTLAQAEQYPGYQFAAQQGSKGILEGAAAAGGAISGGTLKSLDAFNQNLAQSSYGNEFNQALQTYGAGLAQYQSQLQGQQQAFQQLYAPTALGEGAIANINATGTQTAQSLGQLLQNLGATQAAGTIGSANALNSAIAGGTNALSQGIYYNNLSSLLKGLQQTPTPATPATGGPGSTLDDYYGLGPGAGV
jgi:hypothetical protein